MPLTMYNEKRILVSWYTDPRYIPPFVLSSRQVTLGPNITPNQPLTPFDGFSPYGRYDLHAALKSLNLPTEYDAIVVWSDAHGANQPVNLEAFDCPKVLCVGDTHHMANPIRMMIEYAKAARYDFHLSSHNRHHIHWFLESGLSEMAWIPGIKVRNICPPFTENRKAEVCFFGSAASGHPRRLRFLTELTRRKAFPLAAMFGTREQSADRYASSAISLNCSLNGDLNLRVFEILSACGCLMTDRLSPQSGIDRILEDRKEYVAYDSIEECIDQARFLIAHPEAALDIARAGHRAFNARMTPEQRAKELFDWVFTGKLDSLYRVTDFARPTPESGVALSDRIRVYEELQELHRLKLMPNVLFLNGVPDIHILDALDLRHLRLSVAVGPRTAEWPEAIARRCSFPSLTQMDSTVWDCFVSADGAVPKSINPKQTITAKGASAVQGLRT